METLGIIPARGGSKRVENKNIREVGGKPLIAHAIEDAREANEVDHCVVSTDSSEIKKIALEYGGNVPFERPEELATDTAASADVVKHAIEWAERKDGSPSIVALIQPTSPMRTATDIDAGVQLIKNNSEATSLISVTEYQTPPQWAVEKNESGVIQEAFDLDVLWADGAKRGQDMPRLYHPNGALFIAKTSEFLDVKSFYTDTTLGYEMPAERSVDIDEPFDLEMARALYEYRNSK